MHPARIFIIAMATSGMSLTLMQVADADTHPPGMHAKAAKVFQYWTAERRKNAIPRELVIDSRGLGYLRKKDGTLVPYGHRILSQSEISPRAKPPSDGSSDTTPPEITILDPNGATIGASHEFKAEITDASGIKTASFVIQYPNGNTQSFNASKQADSYIWSISFTGFTDGNWQWWVVAKDGAKKGGNTKISEPVGFTVDTTDTTSESSSGSDYIITNSEWTSGGIVQEIAGRIYFEMPKNTKRKGPWVGYVCSGTVVTDNEIDTNDVVTDHDRSIILTAAHCVYDDVNKAFARNVLFIPQQNGTTGSGTDLNCDNDPIGCWAPAFGVVDDDWAIRTFPDNIAWDYAYYVTSDVGAHDPVSNTLSDNILDEAAGSLPASFAEPSSYDNNPAATSSDFTHALGYSYSEDPDFMYCAEDMTEEGAVNWWLNSCGLSGGASGGPWIQPMDTSTGSGPIISVNSWGYIGSPGMAGPKLWRTSAECVLGEAMDVTVHPEWLTDPPTNPPADGDAGDTPECRK